VHTAFVYAESGLIYDDRLDRQIREQEQQYLEGIIKRLSTVAPTPITWALREGAVADGILEEATTTGTGLIVMTTHGRGPVSRFWLGSVADDLVRRAPCPLLLVRPQETTPDPTQEPVLRHVVIPLDGSAVSEQVLEQAVALGRLLEADFTLLRVVKPVLFPGHDPTELRELPLGQPLAEQMQSEARTYLEGVAERLRAQSLRVQTRVVVHTQPAVSILDQSLQVPNSVIALATHGRTGLKRLLGSVADKVIRGASVPVLVYRPH
jgi:nucleotide-binding universal stress UspA family protein